jgi:hypothetical protein
MRTISANLQVHYRPHDRNWSLMHGPGIVATDVAGSLDAGYTYRAWAGNCVRTLLAATLLELQWLAITCMPTSCFAAVSGMAH